MKSYFKIGIAVSLAVHVGAFALGGYAMDKLIHKEKVQQQAEDITYVDVSTDQDSGDEPEAEASPAKRKLRRKRRSKRQNRQPRRMRARPMQRPKARSICGGSAM